MNREVELDPTAKKLFTGPYLGADAALLNIVTGKALWTYRGAQQWLRNSRFSPNGKRIVAGFSGGKLVMFSNRGQVIWEKYIGEFPLTLEIDSQYNVYAAGKNRELFSYDGTGKLRWRCRIANHVVTAGSNNMSQDGSLIAFGTVGGMIYAFDSDGEIRWRRRLIPDAVLLGHNALDVTPDGKWIAAGTAGENRYVLLYNDKGTLVWSQKFNDWRDPSLYDHNQTGAITVAISDDASLIAAGFGDSVLRFFRRM
jgi:WD40 repeat protein